MQLWTTLFLLSILSMLSLRSGYVFNSTELELEGETMWGVGSPFYKQYSHFHRHRKSSASSSNTQSPHLRGSLQSNQSLSAPKKSKKHLAVAFYHILAEGTHFRGIVNEQRLGIKLTGLYEVLDHVFYSTIGPGNKSDSASMFQITGDPKYQHLFHYEKNGEEIFTLGLLYRFCRSYPSARVLYFHDKGSFHASPSNTFLRHTLNCHVLNPQCFWALENDDFDTCSFRASPSPFPHYTGNFWWATCGYINSLVDPWSPYTNETFNRLNNEVLSPCVGVRGRYFAETWIGTGPTLRPADCIDGSVDREYLYGYGIPKSFQRYCHGHLNQFGGYGEGKCGLATTWLNGSLFKEPFVWMKRLDASMCRGNLSRAIEERTQAWYGQSAVSYHQWAKAIDMGIERMNLSDRTLIRQAHDNSLYMYVKEDDCIHGFPNWSTFVRMGFDLDQVQNMAVAQFAGLTICGNLPSV